MFYLENLYRSAELRYWSTIVLIATCFSELRAKESLFDLQFPQHDSTSTLCVREYLTFYYSTALLNIASCQVRQPNRKKAASYIHNISQSSPSYLLPCSSSFSSLLTKSPNELCDLVLTLFPNDPIPYIRKAQIMNFMKRYNTSIYGFPYIPSLSVHLVMMIPFNLYNKHRRSFFNLLCNNPPPSLPTILLTIFIPFHMLLLIMVNGLSSHNHISGKLTCPYPS